MSEWRELTWDDAMQRGSRRCLQWRDPLRGIDADQAMSNIDIEKHLRRAELKARSSPTPSLPWTGSWPGNETTPAVRRHAERAAAD